MSTAVATMSAAHHGRFRLRRSHGRASSFSSPFFEAAACRRAVDPTL